MTCAFFFLLIFQEKIRVVLRLMKRLLLSHALLFVDYKMVSPSEYSVPDDFSFKEDDCVKYNIPLFLCDLKAYTWLNKATVTKKYIEQTSGKNKDPASAFGAIIHGFQSIVSSDMIDQDVQNYAVSVLAEYKKTTSKNVILHKYGSLYQEYRVQEAKVRKWSCLC